MFQFHGKIHLMSRHNGVGVKFRALSLTPSISYWILIWPLNPFDIILLWCSMGCRRGGRGSTQPPCYRDRQVSLTTAIAVRETIVSWYHWGSVADENKTKCVFYLRCDNIPLEGKWSYSFESERDHNCICLGVSFCW